MALLNQILEGRYNTFLRAKFLDEQSGVETLAPELQPVFVVEGERLEHRLLKQERAYAGFIANVAGVGTRVFHQLLNPPDSGALIWIEELVVESNTEQSIELRVGGDAAIGAQSFNVAHVDRRPQNLPLTQRSGLQMRSLVAADPGVGNLFLSFLLLASTSISIGGQRGLMVLGPGRALIIKSTADSANLRVNAFWSERGVRASELG